MCVDQVNQDFEEESAEQRSSVSDDLFLATLRSSSANVYSPFLFCVLGLLLPAQGGGLHTL